MLNREPRTPVLVAVVGNESAGDDAFGPLVGRALCDRRLSGVEVIDLSTDPAHLLEHLAGREMLILVDAVVAADSAPADAGRLVVCPWTLAAAAAIPGLRLSTHGLSLADQLRLAEQIGLLPPLAWLIGVTIEDAAVGGAVTRRTRALVEVATDRACELIAGHAARCAHAVMATGEACHA